MTALVGGRQVASVSVAPRAIRELIVRLHPAGGLCTATFTVSPTAIPNVVTKGRNPDTRNLGIHFNRFTYKD